jgi:hypothetical protein
VVEWVVERVVERAAAANRRPDEASFGDLEIRPHLISPFGFQ